MINFIKEQLVIWRLKQSLREYARPDRVFLKSARARFVALVQQRAGVGIRAKHPRSWKYATIAAVAVLSLTTGLSVFADANNVPASHPLYNFKRVSEQVRLNLSTPNQQVELHKVFAQRRLEEVVELEADHDDNPTPPQSQIRINGLAKDFQREAENGLDKNQDPKIRTEARAKLCQDIIDTIQHRPKSSQFPKQVLDRVKTHCGESVKD